MLRRLDWDSKFWGVNIYTIEENDHLDHKDIFSNTIADFDEYLIQALIPDQDVEQINILEEKGFRFVETKITLIKAIHHAEEIDINNFKKVEKPEIQKYKNEFYNMYGEVSRYALFSKEKINDFYYTWVINSVDSMMDDKCIGYYVDNQLAGFITYRFKDDEVLIGLVGVFPQFHKRGISQKMLDYVNNDGLTQGTKRVLISTQGINLKAVNAYIKNGFSFDNIKHWYYMRREEYDRF